LHVFTETDETDEGSDCALTLGSQTTGKMKMYFGINDASNYSYIGSVETGTQYRDLALQPNGGNVGIGLTAPDTNLTVVGEVRVRNSSIINSYYTNIHEYKWDMNRGDGSGAHLQISTKNDGGVWGNGSEPQAGGIEFRTNNTHAMYIGGGATGAGGIPQGYVGIGTDSPEQKVHIAGTDPRLRIEDTAQAGDHWLDIYQGWNSYLHSQNSLYFDVGGNDLGTALSIVNDLSSCTIGIGTNSPMNAKVEVKHVAGDASRGMTLTDESGAQASISPTGVGFQTGCGNKYAHFGYNHYATTTSQLNHRSGANYSAGISFGATIDLWTTAVGSTGLALVPLPRISIKNDGNVGIGTTDPQAKLGVAGPTRIKGDGTYASATYAGIEFGFKAVNVNKNTWIDVLTITQNIHTGCYVKITGNGDWSNHSSTLHISEHFVTNGDGGYDEPGVTISINDETPVNGGTAGTDGILARVNGGGGTAAIQLKLDNPSGAGADQANSGVAIKITYEVRGQFDTIT
jgi:hypothetical protein